MIPNPLTKNTFKEFADLHSLVYSSRFEEEAHNVVRGVTLTTTRKDAYLVEGNIEGHDIQLLQRSISLHKPGSDMLTLKWAIMHLSNSPKLVMPHVFLDGNNRYHEDVYESIFTKFSKLVLAPPPYENSFTTQYRIFCNPETVPQLTDIFPVELTEKLSPLGHLMDYELLDSGVYVYLPGSADSTEQLDKMLTATRLMAASVANH